MQRFPFFYHARKLRLLPHLQVEAILSPQKPNVSGCLAFEGIKEQN